MLRRPEQVNSPGHLRTLRRLPCCEGHPADGVDITAENVAELGVGWTGDTITVEELAGYPRPVGDVSVTRASTIAKMVDADTWAEYCALFPNTSITHAGGKPCTGTSLGYNALWWGPYVDAEIVSERDDGTLIGEWNGPDGPKQYDIEHVVDPDCEVVQRLAKNTGFDPTLLGGNHFALALAALTGRGAEQSELMRIVDSRDLPISSDQARQLRRLTLQVPRMPTQTRDATWTVGIDRELPVIESGDWDGDAAAASVFKWAGFDDGNPDPARARRAFLLYDADAPELKGSYKLPIARHRNDRLEVVKSGMDAAAGYLPQTDAPQEVLDRARSALDHYYEKFQQQAGRDARSSEVRIMNKQSLLIGLGRDTERAIVKLGQKVPAALNLTLDEVDAEKLRQKLAEMEGLLADMVMMVEEAKGDAEGMEAKMADMMSIEEAQAKVDEHKAMLMEAEKALEEARAAAASMTDERDALKSANDALLTELAPLRAEGLERFRKAVIARGFDAAAVAQCQDAAAIKRLVVVAKVGGERYSKTRDDGSYVADDTIVNAVFDGVWAMLSTPAATPTPAANAEESPTFANFPRLAPPTRDNAEPGNESTTTGGELAAGMACL